MRPMLLLLRTKDSLALDAGDEAEDQRSKYHGARLGIGV
jgi:hypothetical protein